MIAARDNSVTRYGNGRFWAGFFFGMPVGIIVATIMIAIIVGILR